MKNIQKIAVCCLIGIITVTGKPVVTKAAEVPIAGIDVVFQNYFKNDENKDMDIRQYLSTELASEYKNIAFAQVTDYVNIRSKANEESKILGKLYNNSAASVLNKKGDWYKVKSGNVTGYIKAGYLAVGAKADKLSKTLGTRIAIVDTTTLKVREKADEESSVITLLPIGEELKAEKEVDGWVKVSVNDNDKGYISADYVNFKTEFKEAVSIEEEKQRLAAEAAARIAEQQNTSSYVANSAQQNTGIEAVSASSNISSGNESVRSKIVNYALQFEGNPYVWGGTSLTSGADCSGFTQSVFGNNGYGISRTSRTQAAGGRQVSINNIQPGDLIFYESNGTINHVALYIGSGKVISASSPETGIRITAYNYRQPYKAVSYLN